MPNNELNLRHLFHGRNIIGLDSRYETTINWCELKREAEGLENFYVNHSSGDLKKWQGLCLHGLGTDKTGDAKAYGYPDGDLSLPARQCMHWTEAAALAPQITQFLKSLPFVEFFRVRLFKMNPGGYVGWHGNEGWHGKEGDIDHYTLMVAIHAPKDSAVIFDNGETFSYQKNRSALINFNRWHCATNPSTEDRYMLKIHGRISKNFVTWVQESMEKFSEKRKSIVWGVWGVDLKDFWLNQKCKQITSISVPANRSFLGENPDALLTSLEHKADYVVLVKAGTFVDNPLEIEKEILARKPDFFGHILNYQNEYPFLHDQFVIINIKTWRELGRPLLMNNLGVQKTLCGYEASVDNFHDDYTPYFLKPSETFIQAQTRCGSQLISDVLTHGKFFLNVPQEIRRQKMFMYPHQGSAKSLRKRWKDLDESVELHENHRRFFDIYYRKDKEKSSFWPYNSEPVTDVMGLLDAGKKDTFDSFCGPASGLKLEFAMQRLSTSNIKKLVYFDISQEQLDFKKSLWDSWVGESYQDFVEQYRVNRGIPLVGRLQSTSYQELTLRPWYNNDLLYQSFSQIRDRTQEVHFLNIDIIADTEKLLRVLEDTQAPLFWVSNILTFVFNHMKYDLHDFQRVQTSLLNFIEKNRKGQVIGDLLSDDFFSRFTQSSSVKKSVIKSWRDLIVEHVRQAFP